MIYVVSHTHLSRCVLLIGSEPLECLLFGNCCVWMSLLSKSEDSLKADHVTFYVIGGGEIWVSRLKALSCTILTFNLVMSKLHMTGFYTSKLLQPQDRKHYYILCGLTIQFNHACTNYIGRKIR